MIPAVKPFVSEVVRIFDRHQYPDVASDAPALGQLDPEENERVSALPTDIRGLIAEHAANISDWIGWHGIFSLDPSLVTDETAVNRSARAKLQEFGEPISRLRSPKTQLLSHIFATAFTNATTEEKDRLITLAEQLQPAVEASYSPFQTQMLKVSLFVTQILNHEITKALITLAIAITTVYVYFVVKPLLVTFLQQSVFPLITNFFINHASLTVVKGVNIALGYVDWVINHQLRLFIYSIFAPVFARLIAPGLENSVEFIFNILILPTRLVVFIFFLPVRIFLNAASAAYRSHNVIAHSLSSIVNDVDRERLRAGGQKALRIWLDLSEQKPLPAPALALPQPVVPLPMPLPSSSPAGR